MSDPTQDQSYGEIQLSLRGLYHAGRFVLPDKADKVADAASSLSMETGILDSEAARAGNPKPMMDALSVLHDIYDGLRQTVQNLNYGAVGLIHIADDFSNTDDVTAAAHDSLRHRLTDGPKPEHVGLPPKMVDPVTGGEQPPPDPATPEDDLDVRDGGVVTPDIPDEIEDAS